MEETLIKKKKNILNYILNNNLIPINNNNNNNNIHNSNNIYLPDVIALSFPVTSLIKHNYMVHDLLPNVLNYSTTLDGFPNWYA